MRNLSDREIKNLQSGDLRESLGRGRGSLLFRCSGITTIGYYCYLHEKKRSLIKLGTYRAGREKKSGFSLQELRDKALDYSRLRQEIVPQDIKIFLTLKEEERKQKEQTEKQKAEIEATQGSVKELCDAYVASLRRRNADASKKAHNLLATYCLKPFPLLANKKASEVTPGDIVSVISRMIKNGITTTSNRVRSYLHAAFNYGLKADHDPRQQVDHGLRFHLQFNPVSAVPRQADFERIRDRRLNDDEIRLMWRDIDKGKPSRSPLYGLLIRLCLACYGNRPQQILRCTWEDIDFKNKTLTFLDMKGRTERLRKGLFHCRHWPWSC